MNPATVVLVALSLGLVVLSVPLSLQDEPYSALRRSEGGLGHLFASGPEGVETRAGGAPVHFLNGPLRGLDPQRDALLLVAPRLAYTRAEGEALRDFLAAGGRALVADDGGTARGLLGHAGLDVEIAAAGVFSTSFDPDPSRPIAQATGVLPGLPDNLTLTRPRAVLGAGAPVYTAHEFSWLDEDNDLAPDLEEPRGPWAFARLLRVGPGELLVLGDPDVLAGREGPPAEAAEVLVAWLAQGRRVVVDEGHRARTDPIGVAPMLAGAAPVRVLLVGTAFLAVAAWSAWRPRLRRVRPPRRRRPVRRDPLRRAVLAELPE